MQVGSYQRMRSIPMTKVNLGAVMCQSKELVYTKNDWFHSFNLPTLPLALYNICSSLIIIFADSPIKITRNKDLWKSAEMYRWLLDCNSASFYEVQNTRFFLDSSMFSGCILFIRALPTYFKPNRFRDVKYQYRSYRKCSENIVKSHHWRLAPSKYNSLWIAGSNLERVAGHPHLLKAFFLERLSASQRIDFSPNGLEVQSNPRRIWSIKAHMSPSSTIKMF